MASEYQVFIIVVLFQVGSIGIYVKDECIKKYYCKVGGLVQWLIGKKVQVGFIQFQEQ